MSEQAVITDVDAKQPAEPRSDKGGDDATPTERPRDQREQRCYMVEENRERGVPVDVVQVDACRQLQATRPFDVGKNARS